MEGIWEDALETVSDPKKGFASTRSFNRSVTSIQELREAVAHYCTRIGEKLRKEQRAASYIQVFIHTSQFKQNHYFKIRGSGLPMQTNYTPDIINHAHNLLDMIYKEGYQYKKAGVIASGLVPQDKIQTNLFDPDPQFEKMSSAMVVVDRLNKKYGRSTIRFGGQGFDQKWSMRRDFVSPRYTTVIGEVLKIR